MSPLAAATTTAALLALVAAAVAARPAHASSECSYRVEERGAAASPPLRRLRVGEVDRSLPAQASRFVNEGLHDIRITFGGLAPRVLQHGQTEPARGVLAANVVAGSVECLPSRAGNPRVGPPGPVSGSQS